MTREECIALLDRYANYNGMGIPNLAGCKEAMKMAVELLKDPSLPEGLDEAARKYAGEREFWWHTSQEYAFKAGAEWQKEQDTREMVMSDGGYFQKCYELGKKDMRKEMLEGAVEGEICGRIYDHINVRFADGICKYLEPKNISHIPADVSKFKVGDKVRIIIVKED